MGTNLTWKYLLGDRSGRHYLQPILSSLLYFSCWCISLTSVFSHISICNSFPSVHAYAFIPLDSLFWHASTWIESLQGKWITVLCWYVPEISECDVCTSYGISVSSPTSDPMVPTVVPLVTSQVSASLITVLSSPLVSAAGPTSSVHSVPKSSVIYITHESDLS